MAFYSPSNQQQIQMQQIQVQSPSTAWVGQGGGGGGGYANTPMSMAPTNFTPLPPAQQLMDANRARPITGTVEGMIPGVSRLLYHGYASDRVGTMHCLRGLLMPWTCACLPQVNRELAKGRSVQVYDNKIEINEPDSYLAGCCTCVVRDRISTIHFDRSIAQNASKAEACGPSCSHGDCCPSCFDCYGDTLVVHSDHPGCCQACRTCCDVSNTSTSTHHSNSACLINCCDMAVIPPFSCLPCFAQHKLIFGLENAAELAHKINAARQLKGAPRAQPPF